MRSVKIPVDSRGFSLVEMMVASSLASMILAAILGSFIFMARSTFSIANYAEMNTESQMGLEHFGRDVRSAQDILPGFNSTEFTILLPGVDGDAPQQVTFRYLPNHPDRPLLRIDASGSRALMTGVRELAFNYYDLQAEPAEVPLRVKQIQLRLTLVREALALHNTEKVVSARFILRNKTVSN